MKATVSEIKQQLSRLCSMVENVLALSGMMRGSYGSTFRRCGKPNCWCANPDEKGHLCTKLMWTDDSGSRTRAVKDEDTQTVLEAISQYREFRNLRRNLRDEAQRLEELLDAFERETTAQNRARMGYYEQA